MTLLFGLAAAVTVAAALLWLLDFLGVLELGCGCGGDKKSGFAAAGARPSMSGANCRPVGMLA